MFKILIIGAGGFLGSVLRYGLTGLIDRLSGPWDLPVGTFAVNIVGCLLIGFLNGFVEARALVDSDVRAFLFVGLLGGFTTFSTFGFETFTLLRYQGFAIAATNLVLHVLVGLGAVWAGLGLARNW